MTEYIYIIATVVFAVLYFFNRVDGKSNKESLIDSAKWLAIYGISLLLLSYAFEALGVLIYG